MTTFCPYSIIDILAESGPFGLYYENYVTELDKLPLIPFWFLFVMSTITNWETFSIRSSNQFVTM